jgi:hypothetical protein
MLIATSVMSQIALMAVLLHQTLTILTMIVMQHLFTTTSTMSNRGADALAVAERTEFTVTLILMSHHARHTCIPSGIPSLSCYSSNHGLLVMLVLVLLLVLLVLVRVLVPTTLSSPR